MKYNDDIIFKTTILYPKSNLQIHLPHHTLFIQPTHIHPLHHHTNPIPNPLPHPIPTKPLNQILTPNQTLPILITHITTPTPNHILLPFILLLPPSPKPHSHNTKSNQK
ncbi:lactate racemase domain-containing protein, partial [Staphylococcus saprophyticus]|uniref:lactate racemase domain-containing protein n=1 Tax=Staphylococcus saprophyticus TaxID=29385 RepID=UPI00119CCCC5